MTRLFLMLALCAPLVVGAQGWPSAKPITLIVPFTPGGNVDFAGRVFAMRLQDRLAHLDHSPRHAGTFFMAPDGVHHLEGHLLSPLLASDAQGLA